MPTPSDPIARLLALGGELTAPGPGESRRKFDLAHMRALLHALGDPHRKFPSVLIAGTNGKGSTAATLASILQVAGHRTGLYTSPHLIRPNERIRIDDRLISDEALSARSEQVEAAAARLVAHGQLPYAPSFFETITAIAFLYFADAPRVDSPDRQPPAPVDVAILEVGLGGRLDATNVVDPILSIITDISLDHQEWLGDTIAQITREKAGILRPNGALVTLPQHPEANQAIGELAVPLGIEAVSAADFLLHRDPGQSSRTPGLDRSPSNRYDLSLPKHLFQASMLRVDSPLAGEHQQRNIALAIAAALFLHQKRGISLTVEAIEQGIRETAWPGRLQLLRPPVSLAHRAPILLDAAHNPAGAWALRAALSSLPVAGPKALVFACMADKAIEEIGQILFPVMDHVFLTRTRSPRAANLDRLAAAATSTGTPHRNFEQAAQAMDAALSATASDGLVIAAGSIPLIGEFLGQLNDWF